ncbi:MAG: hypothetical protein HY973_00060 [Candidatus Kerfeldbacteria bacterium]|nr:hypothetical protein [Candidatus Kerfeldbacteria bacterium]
MTSKVYFKNRKWPLIIFGLVLIIGFILAAKLFLVESGTVVEVVHKPPIQNSKLTSQNGEPAVVNSETIISRQPLYLRTGKIVFIKPAESLVLQSEKLNAAGTEDLKVLLNADTKVVEIRVPNFITQDMANDLQNRGQVIKRVPVSLNNLKLNKIVAVLSLQDIYDLKEFTASRVEYEKYFDPSTE